MTMFSFYYDHESSPESEDEGVEGLGVYDERTFYYDSRSCTPIPPEPLPPAVSRMPFELWELIFGFVAPGLREDGYASLKDLLSCALTCRHWAYTAIPMLYKTHGYGVLMPESNIREPSSRYFPISRSIDFFSTRADRKMMKLWRTLLLSCFTASSSSESSTATIFPYINYVSHLDARTLVMVLTEIMKSQRPGGESTLGSNPADYFFGGHLGGLEISGASRGDRMIVGGFEYDTKNSAFAKDIKIFVGDTALMIMDFLYPHIHHLKGFTIPELGQLRTHEPVRMSHPISLIYSLQNLSRLVISSGWMVCPELGKAIATIRPTLINRSFSRPGRKKVNADTFCLTILDWRFKTHYDPTYGHDEDWENDRTGYNWTVGTLEKFFDCLNPNSVTSLDLDFDIRYSRFPGKDLGGGPIALSQSGSFKALRLARMRSNAFKLWRMLVDMGTAGFVPQALRLIDLIMEDSSADSRAFPGWSFVPYFWRDLRSLEFSKFSEMFPLVSAVVEAKNLNSFDDSHSRRSFMFQSVELEDLTLSYEDKHLGSEESYVPFFTSLLPSLGSGLTSLKLLDTDLSMGAQARVGAVWYSRSPVLPRSPLESLTNLKTLVLVGDVSIWLLSDRTRDIMRAMRTTITEVDICISTKDLRDSNLSKIFSPCEKLERLIIRAWDKVVQVDHHQTSSATTRRTADPVSWIEYPPLLTNPKFYHTSLWPVCPKITAQGVRHYLKKCKRGVGPKSSHTVLKEFGFSRAFCNDASPKSWAEVRDLMRHRGGKFLPKLDMESNGGHKAWDEGIPLPR